MTAEIIVTPKGLQTNASEVLAAGGGLVTASNVVCKRPGLIEPRGAFSLRADPTISTYVVTQHLVQFGSSWVSVLGNNSSVSALTLDLDSANALALSQANLQPQSAIIGDSLALALDGGIRMWDSSTTDPNTGANRFAGVPRPRGWISLLNNSGGSLNWLADGYVTAYRMVATRRINGRLYRSAPTDRRTVPNDCGSARAVAHIVPVSSDMLGWELQLYRSVTALAYTSASSQPTDEMRLRTTITVTSGHVAAGFVAYVDNAADADWSGAALYTNATQDGIKLSNYQPGTCRDVAPYNGMTFLGAHRTGHRCVLNVQAFGDVADPSFSLCSVKFGGSTTTGNATITGVTAAALTYLAVGQIVTLASNVTPGSADATFQATAKIQSINTGASTVTLDKTANTTGAVTAIAWDWIKVAGTNASQTVYAGWVDKVGATTFSIASYGATVTTANVFCVADDVTNGCCGGAVDVERAFSSLSPKTSSSVQIQCWSTGGPSSQTRGGTLTFAGFVTSDSGGVTVLGLDESFTVTSTKPAAFSRYVDATTGVTSTRDGGDNYLAWSKIDEPEAFPLGYYTTIGSNANVIYRVEANEDSLFVFSSEGIYRVTGVSPETLSVTQWDPTARMSSGQSNQLTKYGNAIFAWTQRGIVMVTSGGVQNVDGSIATTVRSYNPNTFFTTFERGFAGADEPSGLVIMGGTSTLFGNLCLALHVDSGTWTTFNPYIAGDATFLICEAARTSQGTLKVGLSGVAGYADYAEFPYYDSATGSTPPIRYDEISTSVGYTFPTISGGPGMIVSVTSGAGIIPLAAGDAIKDSAGTFRYVLTAGGGSATLSGSVVNGVMQAVYKAYECSWTYAATTLDAPLLEKRFQETFVNFGALRYGRFYTVYDNLWDRLSATGQTITYDSSLNTYTTTPHAMVTRRSVPTACGRGIGLRINVNIKQACCYFAAMAMTVTYDYVSEKVNRGQS